MKCHECNAESDMLCHDCHEVTCYNCGAMYTGTFHCFTCIVRKENEDILREESHAKNRSQVHKMPQLFR